MRVKRLEIQGFKSFKDKTVVHFDRRITGIVGPNGCGKSNIVDSFFWVMGEMSYKHLRGKGSSDLIFSGSSKYQQLGMAEATLVLETDFVDTESEPAGASAKDLPVYLRSKEVSVTRRVYRTGEGEYFINGLPARLKDIQELFMDTGVGAKGYSVIEQGQIDRVVNSKPEERRKLIEEAAGIAKYKARKKESLRKMEAAQANLSRLNDVVAEIERNLGSLERQAQKARKHKEYKDELFDKEMTWGRRKTRVVSERIELLRKDKETLEIQLVALKAELQTVENNLEADRTIQLTEGRAAEDLQNIIQQMAAELAQEQSALELSRQRQGDLAERLEQLGNEQTELASTIETDRETQTARESEYAGFESQLSDAEDRVREMDTKVQGVRSEAQRVRQELDALKRRLMDEVNRASELTSKAARLSAQSESARENLERVSSRESELLARVSEDESQIAEKRVTLEEIEAKRTLSRARREELGSTIRQSEATLREAEKARNESQRNLLQLRSRQESLEELAAAREGLGDGPKSVLEWARSQSRDADFALIADNLEVTKGYEEALEGWLESRLESLAAADIEGALQAFGQIRTSKQGRASFQFPPTTESSVSSLQEAASVISSGGFKILGTLEDFVSASTDAAKTLIARVAVVESLDGLEAFVAQNGLSRLGGWSIVSREGTVVENREAAGWSLRGGSTQSDQSASLLGRKRAIEELKEFVSKAEAHLAEREAASTGEASKLDALRTEEGAERSRLQDLEVEYAALEREVRQASRALEEFRGERDKAVSERKRAEDQITRLDDERSVTEESLAVLVGDRGGLEDHATELSAELEIRETRLREEEQGLQELRIRDASLRERVTSLRRELDAARSLLQTRERRIQEVARLLERLTQERDQHSGGDSGHQERIEELVAQLGQRREALSILKDRLEQSGSSVTSSLDRIKKLHEEGDRKAAESNESALKIEKLSSDLAHMVQNLEEKYGVGCLQTPSPAPVQEEMTDPVVTLEMTEEEERLLEEEVERLRERIRRLGEVNTMAIEEFEELKGRYDHLVNERQDLLKSVDNLQEAIEHINITSEKRFRVAFEAIAQRFEKLFPIIFGGGRAELSLIPIEGAESGSILDMGVDIMAQPPGKKIASISVLSGGEKALTAISLVFAIFMVKPSPFCLLDEVDAPLDDNNIGKFNALLREMSSKTQFIIITHNKKTMELNDALYGVTMEEPGVSKIVSIELT